LSFLGTDWRGKPLESLEVIINLIAGTTNIGLKVYARLESSGPSSAFGSLPRGERATPVAHPRNVPLRHEDALHRWPVSRSHQAASQRGQNQQVSRQIMP
jgi:hypothetical protein